jgi:hypothetical protein
MNGDTNPAKTAGENRDGSMSLAKESKAGLAVSFATSVGALTLLGLIQDKIDVTTFPGWAQAAGTMAVSTLVGALTAYVKRNR